MSFVSFVSFVVDCAVGLPRGRNARLSKRCARLNRGEIPVKQYRKQVPMIVPGRRGEVEGAGPVSVETGAHRIALRNAR